MRLIDVDSANKAIEKVCNDYGIAYGNNYGGFADKIATVIDNMPTIDAEPVVHGHWIDQDSDCEDWHIHQYECSKCGMGDQHNPNINVPYCWFCGAKMDEDKKCEI